MENPQITEDTVPRLPAVEYTETGVHLNRGCRASAEINSWCEFPDTPARPITAAEHTCATAAWKCSSQGVSDSKG